MPSVAAAFAHERVRDGGGQAVEDGVVRRAQRTAQVGLGGPLPAEFRQTVGGLDQIAGVHGRVSLALVSFGAL